MRGAGGKWNQQAGAAANQVRMARWRGTGEEVVKVVMPNVDSLFKLPLGEFPPPGGNSPSFPFYINEVQDEK